MSRIELGSTLKPLLSLTLPIFLYLSLISFNGENNITVFFLEALTNKANYLVVQSNEIKVLDSHTENS